MPRAAEALRAWDGKGLPDEAVDRGVRDRPRSGAAGTQGRASWPSGSTTRMPGFRTLLAATGARIAEHAACRAGARRSRRSTRNGASPPPGPRSAVPRPRYTALYLLAALDLQAGRRRSSSARRPIRRSIRNVLGRTFWISAMVTLICLVLGYPLAYLLATLPPRQSNLLLILVLLPFWTSLLVRTAAWVVLLQNEGVVNDVLLWLGLISDAACR